jgi:hypothetical protein
VAGSLALAALAWTHPAAADFTKYQCVDANVAAQSLEHAGKFTGARAQLTVCADASCPEVVRTDCALRQEDLERRQPTLVFDVRDEAQHDLVQVSVWMDGQKIADRSDGIAIPVDPGAHTFAFQAPGHPGTSVALVIREGEKQRTERVVLVEPAGAVPVPLAAPVTTTPPPASPQGDHGRLQRTLGISAGAVGLSGIVAGSVLGLLASSALSKSRTECASSASCADHGQAVTNYQTATSEGAGSTAAFIAGGVFLAGGVTLFFTAFTPRSTAPTATAPGASLALVPGVELHGGALLLQGTF